MTKYPVAGQVKTRLAQGLGSVRATQLYRHWLSTLIRRLTREPRLSVTLSLSPTKAKADYNGLFHLSKGRVPNLMVQGTGDLGKRLASALRKFRHDKLLVIGADCPELKPRHLYQAARLVRGKTLVLGPARDGGFWLIGRGPLMVIGGRFSRSPLDGITWSVESVLDQTRSHFLRAGFQVDSQLPALDDMDSLEDYHSWLIKKKRH